MKKWIAMLLVAVLCLSLAACGAAEEEKKKPLPTQSSTVEESSAAPHYKEIMIPFEDIIPAERIVILQNTLQFSREGFYTEETKPVTEKIAYNGAETDAYKLSYALAFLNNGFAEGATVVDTEGNETELTAAQLEAAYIIIDDFQSGNPAVLYIPEEEIEVAAFDHLLTASNEMVISIITEQDRRLVDMFGLVGWDTAEAVYHVMATDKFFIPITPEDYDDGELRGALSGSVNGTFPEMIIAQGKINDVIYLEKVVEE